MLDYRKKISEIWGFELPFYFENADIEAAVNHHFGGSLIRLISHIDGIPDIEEYIRNGNFRENSPSVKGSLLMDLIETAVGMPAPQNWVFGGPTKTGQNV